MPRNNNGRRGRSSSRGPGNGSNNSNRGRSKSRSNGNSRGRSQSRNNRGSNSQQRGRSASRAPLVNAIQYNINNGIVTERQLIAMFRKYVATGPSLEFYKEIRDLMLLTDRAPKKNSSPMIGFSLQDIKIEDTPSYSAKLVLYADGARSKLVDPRKLRTMIATSIELFDRYGRVVLEKASENNIVNNDKTWAPMIALRLQQVKGGLIGERAIQMDSITKTLFEQKVILKKDEKTQETNNNDEEEG